jgi:hypothetical protein
MWRCSSAAISAEKARYRLVGRALGDVDVERLGAALDAQRLPQRFARVTWIRAHIHRRAHVVRAVFPARHLGQLAACGAERDQPCCSRSSRTIFSSSSARVVVTGVAHEVLEALEIVARPARGRSHRRKAREGFSAEGRRPISLLLAHHRNSRKLRARPGRRAPL